MGEAGIQQLTALGSDLHSLLSMPLAGTVIVQLCLQAYSSKAADGSIASFVRWASHERLNCDGRNWMHMRC